MMPGVTASHELVKGGDADILGAIDTVSQVFSTASWLRPEAAVYPGCLLKSTISTGSGIIWPEAWMTSLPPSMQSELS